MYSALSATDVYLDCSDVGTLKKEVIMLEAFNPDVHTQLNSLACNADYIKEIVYWSYGANELSYGRYEQIVEYVKKIQKALQVLESLDKRFNDVV